MKLKVAVVGATGYTGEEIVKILARHKNVSIASLSAIIDKPTKFSDIFPVFRKSVDVICRQLDVDYVSEKSDVVFLALPHTVSMQYVPKFLKRGKRVIDLSADYRLDSGAYKKWYNTEHCDEGNLGVAVYGLPELYRDKIKKTDLIANPGCYPTGAILASAPVVSEGLVKGDIFVDAKSGVTGAGRKASIPLSFGEVDGSVKAYKINEHQHMPEIEAILNSLSKNKVNINFVPHLIPVRRGILSTVYITLNKNTDGKEISELYKSFYGKEPFVRICEQGKLPELKDVVSTNYCDIGFRVFGKLLIVVSCIDNLLKGASGQSVQNMNIMCGFCESEGLL